MKKLTAALALLLLTTSCGKGREDGLVARWTFDERAAETVMDASGNGNDGALANGGYDAGLLGSALKLDGSDDSVMRVAVSESLKATRKEITVAAWAYRTEGRNVAIVAHGYPTLFLGYHGMQFKWQISLDNGRSGVCYADPAYKADLQRWQHVAATYSGWVARLYVDGQEICNDWTWGAIRMPDVPFTVGAYLDDDGTIIDEMNGLIDDVRIYSRALSTEEIRELSDMGH